MSPPLHRRKRLLEWCGAGLLGVATAMALPLLSRSSNCGGNSAALHHCRAVVMERQLWEAEHPGVPFVRSQLDPQTRARLQRLGKDHWMGSARVLARFGDVRIQTAEDRTVVAVCDTAFDNVPRRWFGKAPAMHAVAYSTGDVGLIRPEAYRRLDLENFTDLSIVGVDPATPGGPVGAVSPPR